MTGLLAGLLLPLAAIVGGFNGFLLALVLGALGWLVGAVASGRARPGCSPAAAVASPDAHARGTVEVATARSDPRPLPGPALRTPPRPTPAPSLVSKHE